MPDALSVESVRRLVQEWYDALDRHDPLDAVLPYLADNGLTMQFPEATLRTEDDFGGWYDTVTHRFFDEIHEVKRVDVELLSPLHADVSVLVNWQARVWNPPAATSEWLGFDASQTWSVVLQDGQPRIRSYAVDDLAPMPGSAQL
ncbi:nuclear transport factor 2 family protein [Micromonospora sp. NPDC049101]|uniref:nuclear transport factor 2 family protein n=1 Tax=Micromonospora sp. NPDC049101 TaxID=3155032 RepID=UPI0033D74031